MKRVKRARRKRGRFQDRQARRELLVPTLYSSRKAGHSTGELHDNEYKP